MRKPCVILLLWTLIITCLTACRSEQMSFGSFYSEEFLTEKHLQGVPVPGNLTDSVLTSDKTFYINMTDDEYQKYVFDVLLYLQGREDIKHLGSPVSSALEAEMFPYDIIAPIGEFCEIYLDDYTFVFSRQEALGGRDNMRLVDEIRIEITRSSYTVQDGFKKFSYNTGIVITNAHIASQWDPCYLEHTYHSGKIYDVPGTEQKVTIYTCVNCGHTEYDGFTGDNKMYSITVPEADEWYKLRNVPDSAPSGTLVQIYAGKIMDADLVVTVNGIEIQCREAGDQWCYAFIMPQEDVVITASIEGGI